MNPEKEFFEHLASGRFMIQKSRSTGGYVYYPRMAEPGTGAADLEWVEASGRGTVYATTVIRGKPPAPDANLALIDLAEGPRMMSRVDGIAPEAVKIGMAVCARIVTEDEKPLIVFEPAGA